jgi:hypothetical protein
MYDLDPDAVADAAVTPDWANHLVARRIAG